MARRVAEGLCPVCGGKMKTPPLGHGTRPYCPNEAGGHPQHAKQQLTPKRMKKMLKAQKGKK